MNTKHFLIGTFLTLSLLLTVTDTEAQGRGRHRGHHKGHYRQYNNVCRPPVRIIVPAPIVYTPRYHRPLHRHYNCAPAAPCPPRYGNQHFHRRWR